MEVSREVWHLIEGSDESPGELYVERSDGNGDLPFRTVFDMTMRSPFTSANIHEAYESPGGAAALGEYREVSPRCTAQPPPIDSRLIAWCNGPTDMESVNLLARK